MGPQQSLRRKLSWVSSKMETATQIPLKSGFHKIPIYDRMKTSEKNSSHLSSRTRSNRLSLLTESLGVLTKRVSTTPKENPAQSAPIGPAATGGRGNESNSVPASDRSQFITSSIRTPFISSNRHVSDYSNRDLVLFWSMMQRKSTPC